jgi:hypothetical protein
MVLAGIAEGLNVSLANLFDYEIATSTPQRLREQLIDGIRRSSDPEVSILYRVFRSL